MIALKLYRRFKRGVHRIRDLFREHFWIVFFTYIAVTNGFLSLNPRDPGFGDLFGTVSILLGISILSWLTYFHNILFFRDIHDLKVMVHSFRNPWSRLRYATRYSPGIYDYIPHERTIVECTVANTGGLPIRSVDMADGCLRLRYKGGTLIEAEQVESASLSHDPESRTITIGDFTLAPRGALNIEMTFDRWSKFSTEAVLRNGAPILLEYHRSPVGQINGGFIIFVMMISMGGGLLLPIRAGAAVFELFATMNNWRVSASLMGLALSDLAFLWLLVHSSFYYWREHPYMVDKH